MQEKKIKDSGARMEYKGGFMREPNEGRPRFELLRPKEVPFEEQLLTRCAYHMAKGAKKYSDRNWEKAHDEEALARFEESFNRHAEQLLCGETDEDHASAVLFNLIGMEYVKYKLKEKENERKENETTTEDISGDTTRLHRFCDRLKYEPNFLEKVEEALCFVRLQT
jgi:hypothetical protein